MHKFSTASPKSLVLTVLRLVGLLSVPYSTLAGTSVARLVRPALSALRDENLYIIQAKGPLSEEDFRRLSEDVDRFLEQHSILKGLCIHTREFPGWEDLTGLISHLRFVRDHHRQVEKVALASDSTLATIAPKLVEHFVSAEIKKFNYEQKEQALKWLRQEA